MLIIKAIPALQDNYIWMIQHPHLKKALIIDPGCAKSVIDALTVEQLILTDILITHHHHDHTAGIQPLRQHYPDISVYTPYPSDPSDPLHQQVQEGSHLSFWDQALQLDVIALPGHTLDHMGFFNDQSLFCGDTLFSSGCGRLFEGTHSQLFQSLQRLAQLPPETAVFCTHEYTLANLAFAATVEPNNQAIQDKQHWARQCNHAQKPSLPSTIDSELNTNPFLRTNHPDVITAASHYAGTVLDDPLAVFTTLRQWKDHFIPQ